MKTTKNGNLQQLLQDVLDDSGYRKMLEDDNETERLENVKSLLDDIKQYSTDYPDSTLDEYLQMIAYFTFSNLLINSSLSYAGILN